MNEIINQDIVFKDLGTVEYKTAWEYQESLLQKNMQIKLNNRNNENKQQTNNYLLFVEHPHVYTLGKSGNEENLLANSEKLNEINASYYKTNRGGDITYHGFGQLVGYPILDLENYYTDIHKYMRNLEEVIIQTLKDFNIKGERSKGETGVWLDVGKPYARKICAMGVKASRWITLHGFALNVNTDLRYFEYIIPCGIKDKSVTSMQRELKKEVNFDEVKKSVLKHFSEVFDSNIL
ncbi:MAG: lipoyl(octanoyl) transferase LipB [Flavobacteriales bacterium]|nr:lipoyl(octanoyl) transferase LipB [Flavobacteriales bacterium]